MAPPLIQYNVVEIDKDCGKYETLTGQWLLCVNVNDDADLSADGSTGCIGDFESFETQEHAMVRAKQLRKGKSVCEPAGLVNDDIKNVKRQNLHYITSKWKEFTVVQIAIPDSDDEDDADDLVGKTVTIAFGTDDGFFAGNVGIEASEFNDSYILNYEKDGSLHQVVKKKSWVRAKLGKSSGSTCLAPFVYVMDEGGAHHLELLKALPLSKLLSNDTHLNAAEVFAVVAATDPEMLDDSSAFDASVGMSADLDALIRFHFGSIKSSMESDAMKIQTFPSSNPERLGKALKAALSRALTSTPSVKMLSDELKKKAASDDEWEDFLKNSYLVSTAEKRHAIMAVSGADVWTGSLDCQPTDR